MSAYHNSDWAECYDLWVRQLFGAGPAEDIPIFGELLKNSLSRYPPGSVFRIVDIGTGSGRVPIDLQRCIRQNQLHDHLHNEDEPPFSFSILGMEPAAAMLRRARRLWQEEMDRYPYDGPPKFVAHWEGCGAVDFAEKARDVLGEVDLVIFAAGGITHLTRDEDVFLFLKNVAQVLSSSGRAIVSILHDTLPETAQRSVATASAAGARLQRIPSEDWPGEVYVKYETISTWKDDIKTERFHLAVEDEGQRILRGHDLEWDMKLFDKKKWKRFVRDAGLRVERIIEGKIQFWYVLERV
jgi:SAM-dependent methyltransferase